MGTIDILKEDLHTWRDSKRLPSVEERMAVQRRLAFAAICAARLAWEKFAAEAIHRITTPRLAGDATEKESDAIVGTIGELAELAEIAWRVRWTVEVQDELGVSVERCEAVS